MQLCLYFSPPFPFFFSLMLSGLCDDSSSSPPPSIPSYSSPLSHSASWEGLSELPTQGLPLLHVTRVRPRPPRRHRGAHIPAEMVGLIFSWPQNLLWILILFCVSVCYLKLPPCFLYICCQIRTSEWNQYSIYLIASLTLNTRPPLKLVWSMCSQHCSENGGISPLDDGLPDFYSKRVLPDRWDQLSCLYVQHFSTLNSLVENDIYLLILFSSDIRHTVNGQCRS